MPNCKSCNAPIRWEKTANGKSVPLDAKPVENGNVVVRAGVAIYLPRGQETLVEEPRFISHFVTCPNAKQHRRPVVKSCPSRRR
jgi:hypothetical protein